MLDFAARFVEKRKKFEELDWSELPSPLTLLETALEMVAIKDDYEEPDPNKVGTVDFGQYQGTIIFVVGGFGYQPSKHWTVSFGYGSCSGCDTLQSIAYDSPEERRPSEYYTVALHMLQNMKEV